MTPERLEELINYYFEQARYISRRNGKTLIKDTYEALVALKVCKKALEIACKIISIYYRRLYPSNHLSPGSIEVCILRKVRDEE